MASLEPMRNADEEDQEDEDDDEEEDDDETEVEDPRIEKFRNYVSKHTVEESISSLKSKLGTKPKPIVIGESMCFSANAVMFYILSEALFEVGNEKVSEQLKTKGIPYYKALCEDDTEKQTTALCSLERFVVETEDLSDLHPVLNALYSSDIISSDETFEQWFNTPNISREFGIDDDSRIATRQAAEPFMNWLRTAAEDEDDEDIDIAY